MMMMMMRRSLGLLSCCIYCFQVGNADSFLAWMKRSSPRQDIRYVLHMERFSDLHMHVYDEQNIIPLNPIAALHYNKVRHQHLNCKRILGQPAVDL